MANGQINSNVSFYSKKKIIHLVILWTTLLLVILANIVTHLLKVDEFYRYLIIFISLISLFIMLFIEKSKLSYYDMTHRYHILLSKSEKPIKMNCAFDNNWLQSLKSKGFTAFTSKEQYSIYYRVSKSLTNRTFIKTSVLELITIIHNNKLDYYDKTIDADYRLIWDKYVKQNKLNKQISIQFKRFDTLNPEIIKELTKVIAYKEGDNYLININCGIDSSKNELYFLHSESYAPNAYYKQAVDLIKDITR